MKEAAILVPFKKESTDHLPETSGVYIFKGSDGQYLYVGKAVNLKKRVRSYFTGSKEAQPKVQLLLKKARYIEYILCPSEKDALILEDTLIKKNWPRYNVRLRDDKAYPFIRIDGKAKFPRIHLVRRKKKGDAATYFGPYTSVDAARKTLRFVANTFGLRTCSDSVMKAHRKRPCLRHQLGHCLAPCIDDGGLDGQYRHGVQAALDFLCGRSSQLLKRLRAEMKACANTMQFERAAKIRDQISAIEATIEPQEMVLRQDIDVDVVGISISKDYGLALVCLLKVRKGRVSGKEEFLYETPVEEDKGAILRAFLMDKFEEFESCNLLIPQKIEDIDAIKVYWEEKIGRAFSVRVPRRGEKKRLLELAQENAERSLKTRTANLNRWSRLEEELKKRFGEGVDPTRVECIDVSHTFGHQRIGALVCFLRGEPYKEGYRLYNLKTGHRQDDYSGIGELVRRRVRSIQRGDECPGIFLVDGGKGQLNAAIKEFSILKSPPLILSIAKPTEGKGVDKIYMEGARDPVDFNKDDPIYRFLQRVRNEAHRFVINSHRKKRQKGMRASFLSDIPGIGEKRKEMLLKRFGGLKGLSKATPSELSSLPGITHQLATQIIERLREIES